MLTESDERVRIAQARVVEGLDRDAKDLGDRQAPAQDGEHPVGCLIECGQDDRQPRMALAKLFHDFVEVLPSRRMSRLS